MDLLITIGVLLVITCICRFAYLVSQCGNCAKKRFSPCKTMIVVGSGGHSMEMMRLVSGLNFKHYEPRVYIVASNDKISGHKVEALEKAVNGDAQPDIKLIKRARNIRQSYFTSLFTTVAAVLKCLPLVLRVRPDLVLCNGPGTCIPICFTAYVMKFFMLKQLRIVYVESICRVEHLSLSAILLYYFADQLLVQWPQLAVKYPRTKFIGRLI